MRITAQNPLANPFQEMRRLLPNSADSASPWMKRMATHAPIQMPAKEPSAVSTPTGVARKPAMSGAWPAPAWSHVETDIPARITASVDSTQNTTMTATPAIRRGSVVFSFGEFL